MTDLKRIQKAYAKLHKVDKGKARMEIASLCGLTPASINNKLTAKTPIIEAEIVHFKQILKIL